MSIQMIPLNKLRLSVNNVRKSGAEENLDELVANVEANGLLQNLIGEPAKKRGFFDIIAGGRRLRALTILAETGRLPKDHPVPVNVIDATEAAAAETSLAENFIRLRMTPTDECKAFLHFLGKDGDVEGVARRFGQTRRFVEGRLRLANLAPTIFELLEQGKMTMEVAQAYATSTDHARQTSVFERVSRTWMATDAQSIRRLMLEDTMKASDPIALLVGRERYEAAGGRIVEDLFSDNETAIWTDGETARQLAASIMEEAAAKVVEDTGLGMVVPVAAAQAPWTAREGLVDAQLDEAPLSEQDEARLEEIEGALHEIEDRFNSEDLDEATAAELESRAKALEEEHDRIHEARTIVTDERKPELVRFLVIGADGQPRLEDGYYTRRQPRPSTGDEGEGGAGDGTDSAPRAPAYVDKAAEAAKEQGLSGRLIDELAVQRRDILSLHLANHPQLALDVAIYAMAYKKLSHYSYDLGVSVAVNDRHDPMLGNQQPETQARTALAELRDGLDQSWAKLETHRARFEAFQALSEEQRANWLAVCVADSVSASIGVPRANRHVPFLDTLGQLLEVSAADWWRPTVENYFGRIKKAKILEILSEIGGSTLRDRYSSCKHGELAQAAEKICAGTAIVEPEVREKAIVWIPDAMRFDLGSKVEDRDGPVDDDDEELLDGEAEEGTLDEDVGADPTEADTIETLDPFGTEPDELLNDGAHFVDEHGDEALNAA